MIGGQQIVNEFKTQDIANPQQSIEKEDIKAQHTQNHQDKQLFKVFCDIDKQVQQIVNASGSNGVECQNQTNPMNLQQQESRPSPMDQSCSQSLSNLKVSKNKMPPLSNQLLRLTKKSTTNGQTKQRKQRQKKVRYYITDFQPYLPSFLDQLHRQHNKSIVRIGQQYQVKIDSHPQFQSIRRPMSHLRIWKGSEQKFNEDALKKFRQLYGQTRTEEELILLKHRIQSESWNDLIKQMVSQKQSGKKTGIVIGSNNIIGATTRNK